MHPQWEDEMKVEEEVNMEVESGEAPVHPTDEGGGPETQQFARPTTQQFPIGTPPSSRSKAVKRRNNNEDLLEDEKCPRTGRSDTVSYGSDADVSPQTDPRGSQRDLTGDLESMPLDSMDIVDRKIIVAALLG